MSTNHAATIQLSGCQRHVPSCSPINRLNRREIEVAIAQSLLTKWKNLRKKSFGVDTGEDFHLRTTFSKDVKAHPAAVRRDKDDLKNRERSQRGWSEHRGTYHRGKTRIQLTAKTPLLCGRIAEICNICRSIPKKNDRRS